jgi:hypothetical protein
MRLSTAHAGSSVRFRRNRNARSRDHGVRSWLAPAFLAACCAATPAAFAEGHPHEHGVARVEVTVEGNAVSVRLDSPLDNLVGFERAPRNDAERKRVDAALRLFDRSGTLFAVDPAGDCKLQGVELRSQVLKLGPPGEPDPDGHAELEADFRFQCARAEHARFVETGLFAAFPRVQRIDAQAVTAKAQREVTLQRPQRRIPLGPAA